MANFVRILRIRKDYAEFLLAKLIQFYFCLSAHKPRIISKFALSKRQ